MFGQIGPESSSLLTLKLCHRARQCKYCAAV